jgi:hypothetical protein
LCYFIHVIWLFDRGGEKITYEICRDGATGKFLLVMTTASGQKRVERIEDPTAVIERSSEQMRRLQEDGWKVG